MSEPLYEYYMTPKTRQIRRRRVHRCKRCPALIPMDRTYCRGCWAVILEETRP